MIITISGKPGAGKTSVGKMLSERLNYKFYSIGSLRRELALKKGLTIDQLNELGEKEFWTDKYVDDYQIKIGMSENNCIIDGRLSFHFIPSSIKIFIEVNLKIATERIFKNQRISEKSKNNLKGIREEIKKRIESDRKRYIKYYGVDCYDKKNYDIIIDTSNLKIKEVVDQIQNKLNKHNLIKIN